MHYAQIFIDKKKCDQSKGSMYTFMKPNLAFACKPGHCTASVSKLHAFYPPKRMKYQKLLNISELEMTMVSLWWRIVSSSLACMAYSVDCHVSSPFSWSRARLLLAFCTRHAKYLQVLYQYEVSAVSYVARYISWLWKRKCEHGAKYFILNCSVCGE